MICWVHIWIILYLYSKKDWISSNKKGEMNKNIEIKAKVDDLKVVEEKVKQLCNNQDYPQILIQEDTFFECTKGRLKLRKINNTKDGLLIAYLREDKEGPKSNDWILTVVEDAEQTKKVLDMSNGITGIVKKKRTLYVIDDTRVHLDEVEGLGSFFELEVKIKQGNEEEGKKVAEGLMEKCGILKSNMIDVAYHDLLKKKQK
eukprot:TRINITY_DN8131_c0_g1_i1.p1 TRINITY_DN8131_c0_g1~~TRINITY_DN8131_c0_g1_i1.p1  ORF type:complete len:202 (-),score=48.02 TRINITY_DN8131_c0_g1_i1:13-618(-)